MRHFQSIQGDSFQRFDDTFVICKKEHIFSKSTTDTGSSEKWKKKKEEEKKELIIKIVFVVIDEFQTFVLLSLTRKRN